MSLRAQRNFCLLAVAGVVWTLVVLLIPIAAWQLRESFCKHERQRLAAEDLRRKLSLPVQRAVEQLMDSPEEDNLKRIAPPENWKDFSIALLAPGVLSLAIGVTGTFYGLVARGYGSGFRPSKGTV